MQQDTPKGFMRRGQVPGYVKAKYGLDLSTQRLEKYAMFGGGPVYRMFGRFPVYSPADIDAWIEATLSPPITSTAGKRALQAAA